MYKLLNVEQVRELERRADAEQGITPQQLMRQAGLALAEASLDFVREHTSQTPREGALQAL